MVTDRLPSVQSNMQVDQFDVNLHVWSWLYMDVKSIPVGKM